MRMTVNRYEDENNIEQPIEVIVERGQNRPHKFRMYKGVSNASLQRIAQRAVKSTVTDYEGENGRYMVQIVHCF